MENFRYGSVIDLKIFWLVIKFHVDNCNTNIILFIVVSISIVKFNKYTI